jgi:predicted MFS family arabinose efflux permease
MSAFRELACDLAALIGAVAIGAGLSRWGWEFVCLWGGVFVLVGSVLAARAKAQTRGRRP